MLGVVKWTKSLRKGRLGPDAVGTEEQVHSPAEVGFSTIYAVSFCVISRKQSKFSANS